MDAFQSHDDHARCRADNQHASAHARAIGQELPEGTVLHEIHQITRRRAIGHHGFRGNRVHAHRACHERHVIDNGRKRTNHQIDDIHVSYFRIQPIGEAIQDAHVAQDVDRQEDAEEEEQRRPVNAVHHLVQAHFQVFVQVLFPGIHEFGRNPEETYTQQDAHEGRQVGQCLEYGHEKEAEDTQEENGQPFARREVGSRAARLGLYEGGGCDFALQTSEQQQHRDE